MILDTLGNWKNYTWSPDRFRRGFEFLEALKADAPDGTIRISDDDLYCMIQAYETKPTEGCEFEAHRDYADIQLVLDGVESILWAPQASLAVTKPYKTDIEFYSLIPAPTELVLTAGQFAVFFPGDAHAPCLAHGQPAPVRKAVVKVRL